MNPDIYVASFGPSGDFRWARALGAADADVPFDIEVDSEDNVYLAGSHQAELIVGDVVLEAKGSQDVFVVSYDADGAQLWAKNWGGEYGETPRALSVNSEGDIFITGSFTGSFTADGLVVETSYTFGSLTDVFVLAVDGSTQEALWLRSFDGLGHDVGTAIVADPERSADQLVLLRVRADGGVDDRCSVRSGQLRPGGIRSDAELLADGRRVCRVHVALASQPTLPLRSLLLKDVAEVGVATLEAAATGDLDPLRGAPVGLHLGHVFCSVSVLVLRQADVGSVVDSSGATSSGVCSSTVGSSAISASVVGSSTADA